MDQAGHIDVDHVARLLGVDQTEARRQLQGVAFDDPGTGQLVPRAEYLSGNVREALRRAEEAAEQDPERYQPNVEALRAVSHDPSLTYQVRLRDGRRITVTRDWSGDTPEARFLRRIRDDACRIFGTTLSPDYNAVHHDHLHLEATDTRFCR